MVLLFSIMVCSGSQNDERKLVNPESIPHDDPAHVVADILNGMALGQIDHTKIIYGKKQKPIPVIHSRHQNFHNIEFKVEEILLSIYDPKTQTVQYSCIVPHPAVSFWQSIPVEPSELKYIPKGIRMKGRFTLQRDEKSEWKVKVDNDTNPISLYNRVVNTLNQIWYTSMTSVGASHQLVYENVMLIIANYAIALGIPDKDSKKFVKDIIKEFEGVVPRRN